MALRLEARWFLLGGNMANDIQMGEPKADVLSPDQDMTPGQEATTPMAVEAAAAAGEAPEATTEAKPKYSLEATPDTAVKSKTETAVEATTEMRKEASPETTTAAGTTAATATATTEAAAGGTTTETTTETTTAAQVDGAEGSQAPAGGDDNVIDEVGCCIFRKKCLLCHMPAQP